MNSEKTKNIIFGSIAGLSLALSTVALILSISCNKSGLSAYEIAVKNGFVGTETEWLDSLKGTDGQNGKDGKDGKDGENGKSVFVDFTDTFEELNTKLINIDTTTYKTPFDRFSQLDLDIEEIFIKYKSFENYFYYSLKDNQFILVDLTDYLLNDKTLIYNTTASYKRGNNFPTKSVDLFKFVYNKEKPSSNYSNYLTLDYVPIGYINDPSTGLVGNSIGITTGLDIGSHQETFIVKYIRDEATSGQEVVIRSLDGSLMVNAIKDTVHYYGNANIYQDIHYPLNYAKLFINDVEYTKPV